MCVFSNCVEMFLKHIKICMILTRFVVWYRIVLILLKLINSDAINWIKYRDIARSIYTLGEILYALNIYEKLFNQNIKRVCIYIFCTDNINIMYADISWNN